MIGSVYDYYLTTYASKPLTKKDTHKKSELRNVYNNIVEISKKSPLYKIDVSAEMQKYAIDLKEHARSLLEDIDNLVFDSNSFNKTKYVSNNTDVISVNTLNKNDASTKSDSPDNYTLEIKSLATPQVNTGNYLHNDALNMSRGDHIFEVHINDNSYEFQFHITDTDTNKSVLEKLSRLIKRSGIGLTANVLQLGGNSALEVTSEATGLDFTPEIFQISNSPDHPEDDIVTRLGINNITSYPSNASFLLNGMEKTSSHNTFTINKSIEITLNETSKDGKTTTIKKQTDLDSIIDSINNLVDGYNSLINLSKDKTAAKGDFINLNKEMVRTAKQHRNDLEAVGLTLNENGSLSFDDSIFLQATNEESLTEAVGKLTDFKDSLLIKANDISINPMKYVNKVMISYPHPVKAFANPYLTSIYSGMMFNGYI